MNPSEFRKKGSSVVMLGAMLGAEELLRHMAAEYDFRRLSLNLGFPCGNPFLNNSCRY